MYGLGDPDDLTLKQPAGVGVGQHDRSDIGRERGIDRLGADVSVFASRNGAHRKADEGRRRGIRAVGGSGDEHDAARLGLSARLESRLDRHHAAKLSVRAGFGRHGDGAHSGHRHQGVGKRLDDSQRALRGRDGLKRMDVRKSRQPSHFLIEARIVLHRARAKRIDSGINRIVVAREANIMAHRLGLTEAGQIESGLARVRPQSRVKRRGLIDVDAGGVEAAGFEDERLLHVEGAISGESLARDAFGASGAGRTALSVHRLAGPQDVIAGIRPTLWRRPRDPLQYSLRCLRRRRSRRAQLRAGASTPADRQSHRATPTPRSVQRRDEECAS